MRTITTTFTTREVKPSELTQEQFVKFMMEDIEKVKEPYKVLSQKEEDERYERDCESFRQQRELKIARLTAEAKKKYKREKNQEIWLAKEISKLPTELERGNRYDARELYSIACDFKPWENGTSSIYISEYTEKTVNRLYEEGQKNKYFMGCTGWSIVKRDWSTEIKWHLPEKLQAEWDEDKARLAREISEFYATCRYCGD